jgi:hypothetical protein
MGLTWRTMFEDLLGAGEAMKLSDEQVKEQEEFYDRKRERLSLRYYDIRELVSDINYEMLY